MIIQEINTQGNGYNDDIIKVNALYFADDGLLLTDNIEDAVNNLKIVMQISKEFGLEINKEKNNIRRYQSSQQDKIPRNRHRQQEKLLQNTETKYTR